MKIDRILQYVAEPWYMSAAEYIAALAAIPALLPFIQDKRITLQMPSEETSLMEHQHPRNVLAASVHREGNIAIIPIKGVIGMDLERFEKLWMGMVDVTEIEEVLREQLADENVASILLDIDSPGGFVSGVPELAEFIAESTEKKNIFAFSRRMTASAAYYLAAGTTAIYATKSARVGSIGVYLPIHDISGLYEKLGIEVDVIKSGQFKAAGLAGTTLTKDQRDNLASSIVDVSFAQFSGHVAQHRKDVVAETMQGQSFYAAEALEVGLIDSVATFRETIADISELSELLQD